MPPVYAAACRCPEPATPAEASAVAWAGLVGLAVVHLGVVGILGGGAVADLGAGRAVGAAGDGSRAGGEGAAVGGDLGILGGGLRVQAQEGVEVRVGEVGDVDEVGHCLGSRWLNCPQLFIEYRIHIKAQGVSTK
ncbi:hypothetical protein CMI37_38335 [Candidatus Pacearchaeota archaeon]|nr:hypothetical protein [Candidatus Pacearchaeota archaeon]